MKSCPTNAPEDVESIKDNNIVKEDQTIKQEDENNTLNGVLRGDLYIIGQLWITALEKALIGTNINIIPVVYAAKPPQEVPQRPPKMKYTELPLYKSPHYEYKDYIEDQKKCPDAKVKLMHAFLLPYIKHYRKIAKENVCSIKCNVDKACANACAAIRRAKNDFKANMRDPNNLAMRQAVVAMGTATGYLLGGGGGIPRRLFFTSIGFLAAGAICFPKETDEMFRTFTYCTGKAFLSVYNSTCGKDVNLRERIACSDELPPPTPQRPPIQCPPLKK